MLILLALLLVAAVVPAHAEATVDRAFGKLDLAFEANQGQLDSRVKFLARTSGYSLFLTRDEAVMRFSNGAAPVVRMKLEGRQQDPQIEGVDALAGTTNYLRGDARQQHTDIRSFRKVRYSNVYPGIDLEYHGNDRRLEYDFIVEPGADPDDIRIGFSGVRGLSIDAAGDLILKTDHDSIVQKKPHVFQRIGAEEKTVEAAYVIRKGKVGFQIAGYDTSKPLIIDPVVVYSTFFGGTGTELGYGIAVDSQGAVYVSGVTTSTDFPNQSAAQVTYKGGSTDAFVFKLDPTGSQLIYATFIGGANTDEAHSIAVDSAGNAYITGFTQSSDFPIVNGVQTTRAGAQEAYALKLNSAGNAIVYSTYLGGSADDRGLAIAVDASANFYVTGVTSSLNFPTRNPFQGSNKGGFADGFITKFAAGGATVYSTYVGGIGNDNPLGIALDASGAAYVTGWTTSIDFPLVNARQTKFGGLDIPVGTDDVFVLKLNPAGSALDYSTYIGGSGSDEGTRIAVDSSGSAYVTGYTSSIDFPTVNPYQLLLSQLTGFDAFVAKLSPDGKTLVFSTYFGGFQQESGTGIAVDAIGAVYVAGYTNSFDLPTANQVQGFIGGDRDAFVAKFDPAGNALVFSTFFGGLGAESATGIALDAAGRPYVVGLTTSSDLTMTNGYQSALAGGQDVFILKLNVEDIVSSSQFQVAPSGGSSVLTKGSRTEAIFGYAVAEPVIPGNQLTGLEIINRVQNGATVSEVGIPSPALTTRGRFYVEVTATGRSVLSIANTNDQDATVDFFYTDQTGATTQFATTTVKAHEHFSRFITDDPLFIFAPGTLNFSSSIPVAATSFLTETNESSELLISHTPIVDPIAYSDRTGNKTITIPELAEGGGWRNDLILVNTTEDRMNGEIRFFSAGNGAEPGVPMEVGIGSENAPASILEFDIPGRGFQKISTSGSATVSEVPFALSRGTSFATPGEGGVQVSGFASADFTDPAARVNGMEFIEYRQLGVTVSQTGIPAPSLRQSGRFFAETTQSARSFLAIANPNAEDVTFEIVLTDDAGASGSAVTLTVPASGQTLQFLSEQPVSLTSGLKRTVTFTASLPVYVTALRFVTNEVSDSINSVIPISDLSDPNNVSSERVTIPQFTDGIGWKTRLLLVNSSDSVSRGEIRFLSPGSASEAPHGVEVGVGESTGSVFEYEMQPRGLFELQTNGLAASLATGTVQITPFSGSATPAAHAIVTYFLVDQAASEAAGETRGITLFETSVAAQRQATGLSFYAEGAGDYDEGKARAVRTSIAIANPSASPSSVQLELRSLDDTRLGISPAIAIPAGGQLALDLQGIPGLQGLPKNFQGVLRLTVLSGPGVAATAFRTLRNERLEHLVTSLEPLNENAGAPGRLVFPYITDSTGYRTRFVLINPPGVQSASGVLHYFALDGTPLGIDTLKLGSVQITPFAGFNTPHAHLVLYRRDSGVLTSIVGVEGELPASSFRMYAESIGDYDTGAANSTRSGIALANPSDGSVSVVLEVRGLNGTLLRTSRPVAVPAKGQLALFLNQVPGLETLSVPFEGVVRVVTTAPQGITATAFRLLYNERGVNLFTTTGPLEEDAGASQRVVFPHLAEGGGYTTQFVVISGPSGQGNEGVLRFVTGEGNPLNLTLATR